RGKAALQLFIGECRTFQRKESASFYGERDIFRRAVITSKTNGEFPAINRIEKRGPCRYHASKQSAGGHHLLWRVDGRWSSRSSEPAVHGKRARVPNERFGSKVHRLFGHIIAPRFKSQR